MLKKYLLSVFFCCQCYWLSAQSILPDTIEFYGDSIVLPPYKADTSLPAATTIAQFVTQMAEQFEAVTWLPITDSLLSIKKRWQLDDWLFYQLIRKTAQLMSPKKNHYERYTLCKWFLLTRCGYDATLKTSHTRLLLYVASTDKVFNIPYYFNKGKQYICLNYHDYNYFDIQQDRLTPAWLDNAGATGSFSYKIQHIPEGKNADYVEKELQFENNRFVVRLNPAIQQLFANYPSVDYESYFNIPLSRQTYQSLIPALQKRVEKLSEKKGIEFLMHFTRYAFLFETDSLIYGREKRLSPELTLLYKYSDCEDRAALFFYLVKEIYHLPMIVLAYPRHVTIAIKLKKPVGKPIVYNGEKYTITEPTPQSKDVALGKMSPGLKNIPYEVVYVYKP